MIQQSLTLIYIQKFKLNQDLRYLSTHVRSKIQEVEVAYMCICLMNKDNVIYTYNEILFSLKKKKGHLVPWYNVD